MVKIIANKFMRYCLFWFFCLGANSSVSAAAYTTESEPICGIDRFVAWSAIVIDDPNKQLENVKRSDLTQENLAKGISRLEAMALRLSVSECENLYPLLAKFYDLRRNHIKANYWARKGAEVGSAPCCFILAVSYMCGQGVVQDPSEANKWAYLCVAMGDVSDDLMGKDIAKYEERDRGGELPTILSNALRVGKQRAKEWQESHLNAFNPYPKGK